MNTQRLFSQSRLTWRAGALLALTLALLILLPAVALAQSPPATPSSITVTRGDGTVTASWQAVSNATAYHITYSADGGQSWSLGSGRHTSSSITIGGAKNGATYIVAVRAGNDHGWSGWRNSSPSGPFTPPPPPHPTTPPATPSAVWITRSDGTLTASWQAVANATSYHITYSSNNGKSWTLAAFSHTASSITISSVENSARYIVGVRAGNLHGWSGWRNSALSNPYYPPVSPPPAPSGLTAGGGPQSVTLAWDRPIDIDIYYYQYQYRKAAAGSSWGDWTSTPTDEPDITSYKVKGLTNGTEYRFRLRAIGAGGASQSAPNAAPWYVSATPEDGFSLPDPVPGIQPPERPASVTLSRSTGTLSADWDDVARATSYHITYSDDGGSSWTFAAINHTESGITISGVTDSATYIVAVRGHNESGYGQWRNSAPITPLLPELSVSNITGTSATLTLANYTGTWYLKGFTASSQFACVGPLSTSTKSLSSSYNLTANTLYGMTAYSGSGCTTALDTAYFSTTGFGVGNLTEDTDSNCGVGYAAGQLKCATAFTTGGSSSGYTLTGVTAKFANKQGSGAFSNIVVAIHAADTTNSSNPANSAQVTLSGSNPDTAGLYTYTCGSGCDLAANTTYFVVMSTPDTSGSNRGYLWLSTPSDAETKHPSTNGWSIANMGRTKDGGNAWADMYSSVTGVLHIAASTP